MGSKVNLSGVVDRNGLRQEAGHKHTNEQHNVPAPTTSRHGIEEGSTHSRGSNTATAHVKGEPVKKAPFGHHHHPDQK